MPVKLNFPMLQNPPIVSADISRYQAMITPGGEVISHFDFDKYAKKARHIKLRCSVANAGLDFEFEYNLGACEAKDVYVSTIYHYTKLWKDITTQSDIIKDAYDMAKSLAPTHYLNRIALDIEANDGLDKNTFTGNAEKLVSKVHALTGVLPDIYTRGYFWDENTYPASWMKELRLWVAHHYVGLDPYSVPTVRPFIPNAWGDINNPITPYRWQFDHHEGGAEWGSTGDNEIDLSFFTYKNGTKSSWSELYGIPYPEPLEPTPIPTEDWRIMTVNAMNIRNEPVISSSTLVGKGIKGKKILVSGEPKNGYVPTEVWIFEKSLKKI